MTVSADRTIREFLEALGSAAPAPGGGGAAALSGALGAALVSMVCSLTLGRERWAEFEPLAAEAGARARALAQSLAENIGRDADAFNGVMAALRMPKGTEAERAARSVALQGGYRAAIAVPEEVAKNCLAVLRLAKDLVGRSNANAANDLSVAALQAQAGLAGALENVAVNLRSIKDEAYVKEKRAWMSGLEEEGERLLREIRAGVAAL